MKERKEEGDDEEEGDEGNGSRSESNLSLLQRAEGNNSRLKNGDVDLNTRTSAQVFLNSHGSTRPLAANSSSSQDG